MPECEEDGVLRTLSDFNLRMECPFAGCGSTLTRYHQSYFEEGKYVEVRKCVSCDGKFRAAKDVGML